MAVLTASMGGLAVMDVDGSEATIQVELRLGGVGDYWDALANGARDAAASRGVEMTVAEEIEPAGCATLTIHSDGETASCGGDAILSPQMFHVGMANYAAGRLCAHYAAKHAVAASKIVVLIDSSPNSAAASRLQGFRDTLRYHESAGQSQGAWQVEVVSIIGDAASLELTDLEKVATEHADAEIIFDFTGGPAEWLHESFRRGETPQQPRLVTFDQSETALEAIETGDVAAVVAHDPRQCGYHALDRLVVFHRSDLLGRPAAGCGFIHIPAELVERGTLAEFRSSLKIAAAAAR
jgi:ABC-type sugar transport system substrate-binding protein